MFVTGTSAATRVTISNTEFDGSTAGASHVIITTTGPSKRRPCEAKIPVTLMKKINILVRNGFKANSALRSILLLYLLYIEYFSHRKLSLGIYGCNLTLSLVSPEPTFPIISNITLL
jgi:hypothetical protein